MTTRMWMSNPSQCGIEDYYEGWLALALVVYENMTWWKAWKKLGGENPKADREEQGNVMVEMREAGCSWDEIGEYFCCSPSAAWHYWERHLKRIRRQ